MTVEKPIAVTCPKMRCRDCEYASSMTGQLCERFSLAVLARKQQCKILILEPDRGLVHIAGLDGRAPRGPPWQVDGWESTYVEDQDILRNADDLIEVYPVGPYLSVYYKNASSSCILYKAVPLVRTPLELALLGRLSKEINQHKDVSSTFRMNLTSKLRQVSLDVAEKISDTLPEIGSLTKARIAEIAGHYSTVLGPFLPILLDDEVEEVYLDRPRTPVYFDHRRLGRCCSTLTLGDGDVDRIATLVRAESNLHLDRQNPSLKTDIRFLDVNLRFSLCLPPLSVDGLHLEIRRARTNPYSIYDLIHNDTLSTEAAALLLLAVSARFNITITGGPGSGKTTLLNALDMSTPRTWRKVYVEDAVESRELGTHHQVRIRVDPLDEIEPGFDKSTEIIKSLHRSPDYLILGEIQTAEHSRALFQAIAAGLRSIQTCHSDSASSLISRWTLNHGIDRSSIALMDLIVTLERPTPGQSRRRVKEIVEIRRSAVDGLLRFTGLNKILPNQEEELGEPTWARDGAFILRTQEQGVDSHLPAYEALVKRLNDMPDESCITGAIPIGERLWESGHPLAYLSG
jgi:type IV secretory pathway ATPase VirB11/archaellum biosynthesis ATPase